MNRRVSYLLFFSILVGLLLAVDAVADPRIGLIWWPADPANPTNPVVESLYKRLGRQLAVAFPESIFVSSESIRDSIFPLIEPATQPDSEKTFAALLARNDIRSRLLKRMDFLVTFTGETAEEIKGVILCERGCVGLAWINKDTRISVVIWDLQEQTSPSYHDSRVEGTTWIPAFILPIPLSARTEAEACNEISRQIVEFIRSRPR